MLKVFEMRFGGAPGRLHFHLFSTHPRLQDLPVLDGDLGMLAGTVLAAIGPVTSAAIAELGLQVDVQAEDHTVAGLVAALRTYFEHRGAS